MLPGQLAALPAAVPAVPADQMFGAPVPMMDHAAAAASSSPATFGHIHIKAEPFGPGADLQAFPPPARTMSVAGSNQGVRDFVKKRIANYLVAVALDEMHG